MDLCSCTDRPWITCSRWNRIVYCVHKVTPFCIVNSDLMTRVPNTANSHCKHRDKHKYHRNDHSLESLHNVHQKRPTTLMMSPSPMPKREKLRRMAVAR